MRLTKANRLRLFAMALVLGACPAAAQTNVSYGKVTAVKPVTVSQAGPQAGGALVGGMIGLATGSGQSSSNRALRARLEVSPDNRRPSSPVRSRHSSTQSSCVGLPPPRSSPMRPDCA
jgi:hypothetical protein